MASANAASSSLALADIHGIPVYGWRRDLDNTFKEKWGPLRSKHIRIRQLTEMIGQGFRYIQLYYKMKREGRRIFIDQFQPTKLKQIYGVPIGGIGCGSINRGWQGAFCRWSLTPGMYSYDIVEADQFTVCIRRDGKTVYQQVLSPTQPTRKGFLENWKWNFPGSNATYLGLYPRAWTVYRIPEEQVVLVCRQISPIFPNDYKDTTIPAGVFVWEVYNESEQPVDVTIMFSFQNGTGQASDKLGGRWNEPFVTEETTEAPTTLSGVLLHNAHPTMGCTMAISAACVEGVTVSHMSGFNPYDKNDHGKTLWEDLHDDGQLESPAGPTGKTKKGSVIAAAVAAKRTVAPKSKEQLEFVLAWDMPNVHFKSQRRKYKRRYARWFGNTGNAAPALSSYAIGNYPMWEEKIEAWQQPILENSELPDWYKSALFNELYYISDGGTIWVDSCEDDASSNEIEQETLKPTHAKSVKEYGKFAYLEGHEYRMYNTYDVHFYASFALAMLWPKLELCIQHDFAMFVDHVDNEVFKELNTGRPTARKLAGSVPHDIGDPEEEPWLSINSYYLHDTSQWKDLNLKFVLLSYRDYYITQDMDFLRDMWPRLKTVMETSKAHDTDGDGLIDNSGFPDQTYDAWTVTGASAYCGGLWLAALSIMCEISRVLGYHREHDEYKTILQLGKESYEKKLWNGKYYNYDCSGKYYSNSIMADQGAGHWFLRSCNFVNPANPVFPEDNIRSALQTIFELNVMGINNGTFGAMNGVRPNGKIDPSSLQAEEVWTGVTYALSASMIQEGMVKEGFQTASGVYDTCFNRLGFAYQTPEAYMAKKAYRSLGYMRPLSIWAMQWAVEGWNKSPPKTTTS